MDTPLKCRIQRGRNQDLGRIFSSEHFDILEAESQTAILKWSFGNNRQIGEFLITGYTVLRAWAGAVKRDLSYLFLKWITTLEKL